MKVVFVIRRITGITGTPEYYALGDSGAVFWLSTPYEANQYVTYPECEAHILNNMKEIKEIFNIEKVYINE